MFDANEIIIDKGVWIEILDFDPNTEQVNIKNRWEVENVEKKEEGDTKKYKVTCKVLNIKEYEKKKKKKKKKK